MRLFLILFTTVIFNSCANIVAPTGGEKDISPPIPIVVIPEAGTLNFNRNSIVISFDEFIQINNPADQILISPALDKPAEFNIKKRTLVVNFNSDLKENTTYTINFGEAIKDVNEGNALTGFTYVFSTGDYIDSASISGTILEASTGSPISDVIVGLYKETNDSVIFTQKPFYFARSNKEGRFLINNIKEGFYKIIAFQDQNKNLLYENNEAIGFIKDPIYISDSAKDITINLFKENSNGKIISVLNTGIGRVTLTSLNQIDSSNINLSTDFEVIEYSQNKDSLTYWLSDIYIDSVKVFVNSINQQDTFSVLFKEFGRDTLNNYFKFQYNLNDTLLELGKQIKISAPFPISKVNLELITIYEDSTRINPKINLNKRLVEIEYPWKEKQAYTLIINEGAFENIYEMENQLLEMQLRSKSKEEYGTLILKADLKQDQQYILQLFSGRNNELVYHKTLQSPSNLIRIDNLNPGSYTVRLIIDKNKNQKWDTGNYLLGNQPEKVISYPSPVSIKANWETEIDVIIE